MVILDPVLNGLVNGTLNYTPIHYSVIQLTIVRETIVLKLLCRMRMVMTRKSVRVLSKRISLKILV
ncbi:hypothetical protein D3C86_1250020 [compost metagenome]